MSECAKYGLEKHFHHFEKHRTNQKIPKLMKKFVQKKTQGRKFHKW